MINRLETYV